MGRTPTRPGGSPGTGGIRAAADLLTQFFPGVVLGLFWRRATARPVFAGMLCGEAAVAFLMLSGRDPFHGWSTGFPTLCLNFVVTIGLSVVFPESGR